MIYINFTIYNNSNETQVEQLCIKQKKKELSKLLKKTQINMKNLLIQWRF